MKKTFVEKSIRYSLDRDFNLLDMPRFSGVYCFLSEDKEYLYVGKAKNLRNRISSYLRAGAKHNPKTELMLLKARFIDIFITKNEKEALILEARLISQLKPKYNIRLRDDKAYPFIRIGVRSKFPRISIVRRRGKDGAAYFGPFTSSRTLRTTLNVISTVFKLRTCTDASMNRRQRPCLKYQIKRCSGPCTGEITADDYRKDVKRACQFLKGKTGAVKKSLEKAMNEAAERLEFEKAAILRDSLRALDELSMQQSIVSGRADNFDVIGIHLENRAASGAVLKVREGALAGTEIVGLEIPKEDNNFDNGALYSHFIKLFYADSDSIGEIVLPELPSDKEELEEYLALLGGSKVKIVAPRKGKRRQLVNTAIENARQFLTKHIAKRSLWKDTAQAMKVIFNLKRPPNHVEGVDISNTSGQLPVGSLVCFKYGEASKDCYRQFNLKTVGPDDFAMIYEVMRRRLNSGNLPDLFIIDGGLGQLSSASKALAELDLLDLVDIISIAKERDGRKDRVYILGSSEPIYLDSDSAILRFCQMVRDEAHRFGITRHRRRRQKSSLSTQLDQIEGLGPKRRMALLKAFGSIQAIRSASIRQLEEKVPGLPKKVAKRIYDFFNNDCEIKENGLNKKTS